MSFTKDIRRFTAKTIAAHNAITRTATLGLFQGVVKDTPVDTGRARGGWTTTVGSPGSSPDREDNVKTGAPGGAAYDEVFERTPEGAGQVTYLANDLPYIEALERGYSEKAANGMVRINMDRVEPMIEAVIRKNKV